MTEFDFIRRYLKQSYADQQLILGIGDDAAILRPDPAYDLHVSSDMLVKNRHFFADVDPADLAYKMLAVNLSDMAAMGATPKWALLSAALPELNHDWLQAFCDSLFATARQYGVYLIGGDTTRGDHVFNITILGQTPRGQALRRDAAQVGDDVWVSGSLGLAAAALNHCWGKIRLPETVWAHCEAVRLRPNPRVALGQALLDVAHAAQDVSDGLAQDLSHILAASRVGADLWVVDLPTLPALKSWWQDYAAWLAQAQAAGRNPRPVPEGGLLDWMLAGGDDYELVFTASPQQRALIRAEAVKCQTPVARIGQITAKAGLRLLRPDGSRFSLAQMGFDHFG